MENKKVDELLARARAAQAIAAEYTQEQVDRMVDVVAKKCWDDKERIAQLCVDDRRPTSPSSVRCATPSPPCICICTDGNPWA